ncbi:LAMI_0B02344g1_1 [Lachancea mirantina]|uniref:LAMI_0B02344g1_1 n=1 Tax=Lachancea mirantina TaxID=1230905 RepID=A0A1G4IU65_9SACH|nr:LAMI_0B02344g1_1 [Lachancea mirantina]
MSKADEKRVDTVEAADAVEDNELQLSASSSDEGDVAGFSGSESEVELEQESQSGPHTIKKLSTNVKVSRKDAAKAAGTAASHSTKLSGIVYVSRLPKGFHERELAKYFSQFGDLKEVRLARNRKTGNSRHYGFIQFVNKDDALVAQETMNNYLLMGHLLQVTALPKGKKIEKLFKYRGRAFSEAPVKKTTSDLKKRAEEKHQDRISKLQEQGINFKW